MWSARRREQRGALASFRWQVVLAVAATLATSGAQNSESGAEYCSRGGSDFNSSIWQRNVNKEVLREEFRLLRLYCCPQHFDKIRWFRVYEQGNRVELTSKGTLDKSTFVVQEEGLVLHTNSIQGRDAGRYECVVQHNDSNSNATLLFKVDVSESNKPIEVKPELVEPKFQRFTWRVGDIADITCSIFGGNKDLDLKWMKIMPDGSLTAPIVHGESLLTNVKILAVNDVNSSSGHRKAPKTRGQRISFEPLRKKNFGNFSCLLNGSIIRNVTLLEGGYSDELTISLACLSVVFVLLIVTIPIGWFWRWEILLFWKDRFGKLEENDDKEYDVFVSYDTQDAPFVLGILVPVLEDHFHYRCYAWERDSLAGEWISDTLVQSIRVSRRFLMVLSPALLENRWCIFALHIALKAVLQLKLHIICVKIQDIDWSEIGEADKSSNDIIRQVLYVVRTVEWKENKQTLMTLENQQFVKEGNIFNFDKLLRRRNDNSDDTIAPGQSQFWRKLRLYLPPRRSLPVLHKQPESPTSTKSLLSLPRGCEYC